MKTVELFRDFDYRAHPRRTMRFHAGDTYARVLELAAQEIERNGAGRIICPRGGRHLSDARCVDCTVDASHAFRPRQRQ